MGAYASVVAAANDTAAAFTLVVSGASSVDDLRIGTTAAALLPHAAVTIVVAARDDGNSSSARAVMFVRAAYGPSARSRQSPFRHICPGLPYWPSLSAWPCRWTTTGHRQSPTNKRFSA
jgi:hypothetical protein